MFTIKSIRYWWRRWDSNQPWGSKDKEFLAPSGRVRVDRRTTHLGSYIAVSHQAIIAAVRFPIIFLIGIMILAGTAQASEKDLPGDPLYIGREQAPAADPRAWTWPDTVGQTFVTAAMAADWAQTLH